MIQASEPTGTEDRVRGRVEPISVRIPEACRLTGIGRSKLYQLIASGDLEVIKIGAMTLVPFENLRALVHRRCRPLDRIDPTQER